MYQSVRKCQDRSGVHTHTRTVLTFPDGVAHGRWYHISPKNMRPVFTYPTHRNVRSVVFRTKYRYLSKWRLSFVAEVVEKRLTLLSTNALVNRALVSTASRTRADHCRAVHESWRDPRVGSGSFQNSTVRVGSGRVGSGRDVFKISPIRLESG